MYTHLRFYLYSFIFAIGLVGAPIVAHGATISFEQPQSVAIGQQFVVGVVVDTQGVAINAVEGTISYDTSALRLVRIQDGGSIVPLWIQQPAVADTVTFSGIIPNGFNGFIDPFNTSVRKPGTLMELVFEPLRSGVATVRAQVTTSLHDGRGSTQSVPAAQSSIVITSTTSPSVYMPIDRIDPTLQAERVRDPDLYDGAWTLVFSAQDAESGVSYVEVRESVGSWKRVTSPYRLEDQRESATLQVRVVDYAGNSTTVSIGTPQQTSIVIVLFVILMLVGFPLMVVLYKRYAYKS